MVLFPHGNLLYIELNRFQLTFRAALITKLNSPYIDCYTDRRVTDNSNSSLLFEKKKNVELVFVRGIFLYGFWTDRTDQLSMG